jgi:hypothetical protein
VAQSEIVHAFLEGTMCWDLVRELGRSLPVDSNELFDIATSFAVGGYPKFRIRSPNTQERENCKLVQTQ